MSVLGWIQAGVMIAALIALIVALIVSQRTRKQAATKLSKSMAPQWRDEGYRAGIMREPTTLSAGVDISCTITAADMRPRKRRHVKVYQPGGWIAGDPGDKVYYGQRFTGAIFDHIELVDPPKDLADVQWMREHLMTRIAPGGKLRLSKDMVPHGKSD